MKRNKRLLCSLGESALLLSLSALIIKIIGVVYKVPLSYLIGQEGMGYFNSAYTIYGFFYTICTSGIPKAITILITREECEGRAETGDSIYRLSLRVFGALGATITFLYIILARPLSKLVGNSAAWYSVIAIGPSIVFVVLSGVARGYLTSKVKMIDIAISQLIEGACKLVLGLGFAYWGAFIGMSIPMISAFSVLGIAIGSIFSSIYLLIRAKKLNRSLNARQSLPINKKRVIFEIAKISLPITFSSSLLSLSSLIDLAIIMRRLQGLGLDESEASAQYGNFSTLAIPMLMLLVSIVTPICVPMLPRLTEHYCKGDKRRFNEILNDSVDKILFLCAPSAVCFYLFSFEILDILFTSQASVMGGQLLSIIAPSVIFLPLLTAINTALESIGRVKYTVASLLIGALVKSILAYILIGLPEIGILGAAISTTLSYLISLIYSLFTLYSSTKVRGLYKSIFKHCFLAFLSFEPVYLLLYVVNKPKNHFINLIMCSLLGILVYIIFLSFSFRFDKKRSKNRQVAQTILK